MGSIRITLLLALGAQLWSAAAADATADAPRPEAEATATVTVTAEALPVELAQTPNPVLVLDQDDLARSGAANLGDLLQTVLPGQVFASGGVGTATSIYLGGARAQDTVVTLDGLRLDDASGLGGVNASAISLAGLDRVEVQQGPCSTRFGSNAQGGAIALYSAGGAPQGFSGEARAAAGNQGVRRGGLGAAWGSDQGWIRVATDAQREDQVLDPDNPYRSVGSFIGLGRLLGQDSLVTFNYFNSYSGVPIPVDVFGPGPANRSFSPGRQDFNRSQILDGTLRSQLSATLALDFTLGQVQQDRLEPNAATGQGTAPYDSRRNQAVGRLTWQPSDRGSLALGWDGSEENASSPDLAGNSILSATGSHLALLLEGERELAAGLRGVVSLRTGRDRQTVPVAGGGTTDDQTTETTGKAGLNWSLPDGFRVFANAGTGFSNPLLYNAIFNAQYGGAALANERSRSAQLGLGWQSGPWSAGVLLSRTLYQNLVYYDFSGGIYIPAWAGMSGIFRNGSQFRIQSAEFKLDYRGDRWGAGGFYRNQEARDLLAPAGQQLSSADAIVRSPFQTLGAHAYRTLGAVRLDGTWSWIGPRYDSLLPAGTGFHEHFNDLALAAVWTASRDLTLTLRGEHLLQPRTTLAEWLAGTRDYQNDASQVFGYPAQPPTVTLEARYRF